MKQSRILMLLGAFLALSGPVTATTYPVDYITGTENAASSSGFTATGHDLDLTLSFAPTVGKNLTVIDNTSLSFISGVFNSATELDGTLDQGDPVNLTYDGKTYYFVANYYGGDGNDLVLHWEGTRPYAWGSNSIGQLGDNSIVQKDAPAAVVNTGVLAGKTVLKVAAGSLHTLALLSDGNVAAWGENGDGQLGTGNNTDSSVPVLVTKAGSSSLAGKTVVAISAGALHSLALCSDGTVHAWGYNATGQLGNNSATNVDSNIPVAVKDAAGTGTLSGIVAIATGSGAYHSFAIDASGTLYGWGRNTNGCIGDGTTTTRKLPVSLSTAGTLSGKTITQVSPGLNFTLALASDSTRHSWGLGTSYQLGTWATASRSTPGSFASAPPAGQAYVSMTAGDVHGLMVRSDGFVMSWGNDTYGQTGGNSGVNTFPYGYAMSEKKPFKAFAGQHFNLVLCDDGTLGAWGRNQYDQLGIKSDAAIAENAFPVSQESFRAGQRFIDAAAGQTHAVALVASPHTALSLEETLNKDNHVAGSTVNFGAGSSNVVKTFIVTNRGNVSVSGLTVSIDGPEYWAFSPNTTGMLSTLAPGTSTQFSVTASPSSGSTYDAALHITSSLPADLADFDTGLTITGLGFFNATFENAQDIPITASSVTATGTLSFTLNLLADLVIGTELTVIDNTGRNPISGTFSNLAQGQEVLLTGLGKGYLFVADYYGGDGNDLVLHWQDSKLFGWGNNGSGTLGTGSYSAVASTPVAVDASGVLAGKTVVKVAAGDQHALALCSDGTLAAWGYNVDGQLGDNTLTGRATPALVYRTTGALTGKTVVDIAAGSSFSMALCSDGTVAAWGDNYEGQLGDNTVVDKKIPTLVNTGASSALNGKTVVRIALSGFTSMALCSDGTVAVWGDNTYHIGLGVTASSTVKLPTAINPAIGGFAGKNPTAITGGPASQRYLLNTDGSLLGWGYSVYGLYSYPVVPLPEPVNATEGVSALYGQTIKGFYGNYYSLSVLGADGRVFSAGQGSYVGDNTSTKRTYMVAVNADNGVSALYDRSVRKLSGGVHHMYALCTDGNIVAWGSNADGQLGIGSSGGLYTAPVLVDTSGLGVDDRFANLAIQTTRNSFAMVASPQALLRVYEEAGVPNNLNDDILRADGSTSDLGDIYAAANVTTAVTSKSKTYHVADIGTTALSGVSISIVGTHAAYFSVDSSAYPTLVVTYTPSVAGSHTAALRITSNAAGSLATYDVNLTGTAGTSDADAVYNDGTEIPLTISSSVTISPISVASTFIHYSLNFAPTPGMELTLIKNDGIPPVTGTFSNLSHGSVISLPYGGNYYNFAVNYYGGDGNDVVLIWAKNRPLGWGENGDGQLGTNDTNDRELAWPVSQNAFTSPSGLLYGKTILSTAVGGGHTLVLCNDGKVYAWGDNQYGQLGDNSTTDRDEPVAVNTASGVSVLYNRRVLAIAAGKSHSLAMYLDTSVSPNVVSVAAWGLNNYGQLGDKSSTNRSVPVAVYAGAAVSPALASALYSGTAKEQVYAIAAGESHSLALFLDTTPTPDIVTIAAWGRNNSSQLGDSSTTDRNNPVNVTNASGAFASVKNARAIAAGGSHSLAVRSDGAAVAWGLNGVGQLGDNTLTTRSAPVAVNTSGHLSGKTVTDVAAGYDHSLALCSDNAVVNWGGNAQGQLALDGVSTPYSTIPLTAIYGSVDTIKKIAGGNFRSLAVYAGGGVATWGDNTGGRLGNNDWVNGFDDSIVPDGVKATLSLDELVTDVADGSCSDHGFVTASRLNDKAAFEVTVNGHVLDSFDILAIGSTGPGSSSLDPLTLTVTNTGTLDIDYSFSLGIDDDVSPGNAFGWTSTLGSSLSIGSTGTLQFYRDTIYPGDQDGRFSVYNYRAGYTLYVDFDGF